MAKIIDKDVYKAQKLAQVHEYEQKIKDAWGKYSADYSALAELLSSFKYLHEYSARNVALARKQFPGCKCLASFKAWHKQGVKVNKGAKSIKILAPCFKKETDEKTGEDKEVLSFFRLVPVFDVAQTDRAGEVGAAMAGLYPAPSSGAASFRQYARAWNMLAAAVERAGFEIDITQSMSDLMGAHGLTNFSKKTVYISDYENMGQRVAILAHELGHVLMHGDTRAQKKPRAFKECEAEAFAFMVCDFLGIDIAYCSVPYLESWAERKDSKTLETCVQNAWRVAQKLAKEIEAVAAAAEVEAVAAAAEVEAVAAAAEIEAGEDKRDAFAGVPRLTEKMRARYKKGLARGFAGADLATYMTGDCSGRRFDALVSVIDALAGGIRLAA